MSTKNDISTMTLVKYSLTWTYHEGDKSVRRTLLSFKSSACIEAARVLNGNPYCSEIEVHEVDSEKLVDWTPPGVGYVLTY